MRFWNLGGTALWMDEAITMALSRLPLQSLMFGDIDNHPPLIYVIQHIWMTLFPDPSLYRVPFAFVGSLAVIVVMLMGKDFDMPKVGLLAGMVLALSAGQIYYSQDARQYPYVLLGIALAVWGATGMGDETRIRERKYPILYVLGGFIAIYSQLSGLVAMAVVGFGALLAMRFHTFQLKSMRIWLFTNIVLFVLTFPWLIEIPAAMGTFPGLPYNVPITEIHWHVRTAIGYPGLALSDNLQLLADALLLGVGGLGCLLAWHHGRRSVAISIFGLMVAYPLLITLLHLQSPLVHVRLFVPVSIGTVLGAGYLIANMNNRLLSAATASVFAALGLCSAVNELTHHSKQEDYAAAFSFSEEMGYGDAPLVTCLDYSATAAWEANPDADIYIMFSDATLKYPGPRYWRAVEMTMVEYRKASRAKINDFLGGGLIVEGGIAEVLKGHDKVRLFSTGCPDRMMTVAPPAIEALGYELKQDKPIRGNAPDDYIIMENPVLRAMLYEKTPHNNQQEPRETAQLTSTDGQ